MDYDVIVIGGGQAGVPLATRLARSGRSARGMPALRLPALGAGAPLPILLG